MRSGFPDTQWTLEEMVAEGGKVAARFIMRGTHLGTFSSPRQGNTIAVPAMNFYRLSGGQFVALWESSSGTRTQSRSVDINGEN
jgi:predicted ester cyclase